MDVSTYNIANALLNETLSIKECQGRFGSYWSIEDEDGMISIELTLAEAKARINEVATKINKE